MAVIKKPEGTEMKIHPQARVAENATLIGNVVLEEGANIWYGAVLRGDTGTITVGKNSAVEDNCVVHGTVTIGEDCIIGHSAVLHHCELGERVLIGMGAVVLSGAKIGDDSIIAAGAVVTEGARIPAKSKVMGVPGTVKSTVAEGYSKEAVRDAKEYRMIAEEQLPAAGEI